MILNNNGTVNIPSISGTRAAPNLNGWCGMRWREEGIFSLPERWEATYIIVIIIFFFSCRLTSTAVRSGVAAEYRENIFHTQPVQMGLRLQRGLLTRPASSVILNTIAFSISFLHKQNGHLKPDKGDGDVAGEEVGGDELNEKLDVERCLFSIKAKSTFIVLNQVDQMFQSSNLLQHTHRYCLFPYHPCLLVSSVSVIQTTIKKNKRNDHFFFKRHNKSRFNVHDYFIHFLFIDRLFMRRTGRKNRMRE